MWKQGTEWLRGEGCRIYFIAASIPKCCAILKHTSPPGIQASQAAWDEWKQDAIRQLRANVSDRMCILCWLTLSHIRSVCDPSGRHEFYQMVSGEPERIPLIDLAELERELRDAEARGWTPDDMEDEEDMEDEDEDEEGSNDEGYIYGTRQGSSRDSGVLGHQSFRRGQDEEEDEREGDDDNEDEDS
jgi:hypothetical protein